MADVLAWPSPKLLALGDCALTVEFGSAIDAAVHGRVMSLAAQVRQGMASDAALEGIEDVVPTFRSLTVYFQPVKTDYAALSARLVQLAEMAETQRVAGKCWRLPVCFDAEFAPDLQRVADKTARTPEQIEETILQRTFRVYMIGFLPGFPYMGGWPAELAVPRLEAPRSQVAARSLAIAGQMCAVYPWDSPGGWNLLGQTPVALFDLQHPQQPAMLSAGDQVQWCSVTKGDHMRLKREIEQGLPREHWMIEDVPCLA